LNSDGLIAQALHQHHQMGRRFNEFLVKTRAKPFTDFLVDRRAVEAADLNFTLGCGTTTMVRNRSAGTTLIAKLALLGAILRYHTSINGIPVDAQVRRDVSETEQGQVPAAQCSSSRLSFLGLLARAGVKYVAAGRRHANK
jgi:hypothetical protein